MIYVRLFYFNCSYILFAKYIDSEDAVVRELLNQLNELVI